MSGVTKDNKTYPSSCALGHKGHCCCNCKNQIKLMCHPWNGSHPFDKVKFGKGPITKQCGWVCTAPVFEGAGTYSDKEHGMCEEWTTR